MWAGLADVVRGIIEMAARKILYAGDVKLEFFEKSFAIDGTIVWQSGEGWEERLQQGITSILRRNSEKVRLEQQREIRKVLGV